MASALAIALAGGPAWGHVFPPVRSVVVQVERCEAAVLIGYRPQTGDPTDSIVARIATQPPAQRLETFKRVMTGFAVSPLRVTLAGKALVPSSVQAKVGVEPGGARPMIVVLVTYPLRGQGALEVTTSDPRSTRISWQDQASGRVDLAAAPAQDRWFPQVASFLLMLSGPTGDWACASTPSPPSD